MSVETKQGVEPYRWYQCLVGIPVLLLMLYAGAAGFIFAGLRYGFNVGIALFDDFFETERSKQNEK